VPAEGAEPASGVFAAGFVAIDVAHWLGDEKMFDPDNKNLEVDREAGERPSGSAIIGPSVDQPRAMVVSNGGTDFIYVPDGGRDTAKLIYRNLLKRTYVGALFVNDAFLKTGDRSDFAGALPMSAVNLIGAPEGIRERSRGEE